MSYIDMQLSQTNTQLQSQNVELAQQNFTSLGGSQLSDADRERKLREACEGFESIFIQKMWQQMRATLPQENPLVGREERFWQSMYDQELSKKMAEDGGIGLADMMYGQLTQNLHDASVAVANRTTGSGFEIPITPLIPNNQVAENAPTNNVNSSPASNNPITNNDIYDNLLTPEEAIAQATAQAHAAVQAQSIQTSANVANNTTPETGSNAAPTIAQQYVASLNAMQSPPAVVTQASTGTSNAVGGVERATQVQTQVANLPTGQEILPNTATSNAPAMPTVGGHSPFVPPPAAAGNTQAQAPASTQAQIIRTTYISNMPQTESAQDNMRNILAAQAQAQAQAVQMQAQSAQQQSTDTLAQIQQTLNEGRINTEAVTGQGSSPFVYPNT